MPSFQLRLRWLPCCWLALFAVLAALSLLGVPDDLLGELAAIGLLSLAAWSIGDELWQHGCDPVDLLSVAGVGACAAWLGGWRVATPCVVVLRAVQVHRGPEARSLTLWAIAFGAWWLPIAYLVPAFEEIYSDLGADLTWASVTLINLSDILASPWSAAFGAAALALRELVDAEQRWTAPVTLYGASAWLLAFPVVVVWPLAFGLVGGWPRPSAGRCRHPGRSPWPRRSRRRRGARRPCRGRR